MPKKKPIEMLDDGSMVVRSMRLAKPLATILSAHAKRQGLPLEMVITMWLVRCSDFVELEKFEIFGAEYEATRRQMEANELTEIDYTVLHRSDKGTKSGGTRDGYVGVYAAAHGKRRAEARVRGTNGISGPGREDIGTFSSAPLAAWKRYLHYKKYNLPYGLAEITIDSYRSDLSAAAHYATQTDEQILDFHNEFICDTGQTLYMDGRLEGVRQEIRVPGLDGPMPEELLAKMEEMRLKRLGRAS
jgi:hypothetical protein